MSDGRKGRMDSRNAARSSVGSGRRRRKAAKRARRELELRFVIERKDVASLGK